MNCIWSDRLGALRTITVDRLIVWALIGVFDHEREAKQRVRISLRLSVPEEGKPLTDNLSDVVCYGEIVNSVKAVTTGRHFNLVESLADAIASSCLTNPKVHSICVKVEKLDVYPDVGSVGIEIHRSRSG